MGEDAGATCSAPTSRVEDVPTIRARTTITAGTGPAFTKATTTGDIPITVTILPTITSPLITDGPITRGLLRSPTAGVGVGRLGMAIMAPTTSRIRCILRRLSG